jgi:hypothetical protein
VSFSQARPPEEPNQTRFQGEVKDRIGVRDALPWSARTHRGLRRGTCLALRDPFTDTDNHGLSPRDGWRQAPASGRGDLT